MTDEELHGTTQFLKSLLLMIVGIVGMAVGLYLLLSTIAIFYVLLPGTTPTDLHSIPYVGGTAYLLWRVISILAQTTMVVLAIVMIYYMFTGKLDEIIEEHLIHDDSERNHGGDSSSSMKTSDYSSGKPKESIQSNGPPDPEESRVVSSRSSSGNPSTNDYGELKRD